MKETISVVVAVLIFALCLTSFVKRIESNVFSVVNNTDSAYDNVIILDAGHGGEDGGAVAVDGTFEKDLNLKIAHNISYFFDIFGIKYIEIRTDDISVGDTSLETIRKRKISDINKRYEIINGTEKSVLLSIHQNMFTVEKYSGLQVFFAETETSERLAQCIQFSVCNALQNDNKRKIKKCDKSVYLLYNAKVPSVMVECGFLSNMNELELLKQTEYQSKLSYFITQGMLDYLNSHKEV